jgi:hypothetical protein
MSTDPTPRILQVVPEVADPYDLDKLRCDPATTEAIGGRKALTTIRVRKPDPQSWVRTHPDPAYRGDFPILELRADREQYVVSRELVPALGNECIQKTLFTAVDNRNNVFLWAVRLPSPSDKLNEWWRSEREAAEMAMRRWVRIKANMFAGTNDIWESSSVTLQPEWPTMSFQELIRIAFRDPYLIKDLDHPAVNRLRSPI